MIRKLLAVLVCAAMITTSPALAGARSKAVQEAAEHLLERFGVEVGTESVETLTKRIGRYRARYGDGAVQAIRKTGPVAFGLIDEAGENAPAAIRLLNRHGDQAVWVAAKPARVAVYVKHGDQAAKAMIQHPGIAAPIVREFGTSAARALGSVSTQNARRLAIMMKNGSLAAAKQTEAILDVVGRYGDKAAAWVWRNKRALAFTAIATSFVTDPEPFLEGAVEVARVGGEYVVRPVGEEIARTINWNTIFWASAAVLAVVVYSRRFRLWSSVKRVAGSDGEPR